MLLGDKKEYGGASNLFLGVTRAEDTRTMRFTLLLAAASNTLPTPCKAHHSYSKPHNLRHNNALLLAVSRLVLGTRTDLFIN